MKRAVVFSKRPRPNEAERHIAADEAPQAASAEKKWRWDRVAMFLMGLLVAVLAYEVREAWTPAQPALTQKDIDAAVLHALTTQDLPSPTAKAAAAVQGAVVRVQGFEPDPKKPKGEDRESGVGTGVVIKDDGTILTNYHVVWGAKRLVVTFADGMESPAHVVGVHPDKDLAVVKPQKIPDDLQPAILGSSRQLVPGDGVVAVGFPYGIGPSVSAGVVSGLGREFLSPEGGRRLAGLIQFDAAANPGNSGGPLVNLAGEVVGIVTAILNPTSARTFIGIGFATTIEEAGMAVGMPPF